MPKTTFGSGTIVTPAYLNALQNLVHDGQDIDGHYPKIIDAELSDAANQIKARLASVTDEFKVSLQSGLYVKVSPGRYKNAEQEVFDIGETVLLCTDNALNHIFLTGTGTVESQVVKPTGSLLLATVTTSSGSVASISDKRARFSEAGAESPQPGDFGAGLATAEWVKNLLLKVFFGAGVPTFTATSNSISWGNGTAFFEGVYHPVTAGNHVFNAANSGTYYLSAQDTGANASISVAASEPNAADTQIWLEIAVTTGTITSIMPSKPGFGV